jgi:hypothetical protein
MQNVPNVVEAAVCALRFKPMAPASSRRLRLATTPALRADSVAPIRRFKLATAPDVFCVSPVTSGPANLNELGVVFASSEHVPKRCDRRVGNHTFAP